MAAMAFLFPRPNRGEVEMTIDIGAWERAKHFVENEELDAAKPLLSELLMANPGNNDVLFLAGLFYLKQNDYLTSSHYFKAIKDNDPTHIHAQAYFVLTNRLSALPNSVLQSRDACLHLLEKYPEAFSDFEYSDTLLMVSAMICTSAGPIEKGIYFWTTLAARTNQAEHYYRLGNAYLDNGQLAEAEKATRKAMELDPETYKPAHLAESLQDIKDSLAPERKTKVKRARYPDITKFNEDLKTLICDHIATEYKNSPKIISDDTKFFTIGSCFATHIYAELKRRGRPVSNMDIDEQFNTTFSNRYFFDYLDGKTVAPDIADRIEHIIKPSGFPREAMLDRLKDCDIFIMTLGVAPAFFDRHTGDFVMPKPHMLSMHALAEKLLCRMTTVQENVDNVLHQLAIIRRLNPDVKIIITVSPVPLVMTFEFDSAVVADCISKSTMRLAAQQVVYNSGLKNIYYWPSFEIFRWVGSHRTETFYGGEDGQALRASPNAVSTVMDAFFEVFAGS